MNQFGFGSPTPQVTNLLIVIIASYLAFAIFGHSYLGALIYGKMVLDPSEVINSWELWRLVSYAFLHDVGSPMHVIFNALLLYMVGCQLEDRWGEKRFLIFVLSSILAGALIVLGCYLFGLGSAVVGFSAATVGLLIAWGLAFPEQQIFILGILPLSGRSMVYVTIGLEILFAFSASDTSSAAHFGGIITAFIFSYGLYKPSRIAQIWRQEQTKKNIRRIK